MNYADAQTSNVPATPNFVDSVGYADERTDILLKRVAALADRLCGTVPEPVSEKATLQSAPNGHFESVMATAGRIARKADRAAELLERIERSLP